MKFNKIFWKQAAVICLLVTGITTAPALAQTSAPQRGHSASARGEVTRGYLGVGVVELTDDRVKALHLNDDQGLEVIHLDASSPAAKAGVKLNDVILEVNGKAIEDIRSFQMSIGELSPGTKINLTLWRNGAKQTVAATLATRPENIFPFGGPELPEAPMPPMPPVPLNGGNGFPTMPGDSPMVGFEGEPLSAQLAQYFGVKDGVLVRSVGAKTPAERAGLKAGDVVIKVNGTPVMSPREISGMVRANRKKGLTFTVVRNKKEMTLNVEISDNRPGASDREAL